MNGRSGQALAKMLDQENISYLALDLDPDRIADAVAGGSHVVYGDATRENVLVAAGLSRAKALVISFADTPHSLKILRLVEHLKPGMTATVDIRTGQRSVLKYLAKPVYKAFSGAMNER